MSRSPVCVLLLLAALGASCSAARQGAVSRDETPALTKPTCVDCHEPGQALLRVAEVTICRKCHAKAHPEAPDAFRIEDDERTSHRMLCHSCHDQHALHQ